jgi:ABC-type transporter Mla maintaining outer membrane lipid asymmetry ATPase subunit MlaF
MVSGSPSQTQLSPGSEKPLSEPVHTAPDKGGTTAPAIIEMQDVTTASMRDMNAIVLEHVNWTVAARDYWVVGGLQGSGKSDFMAMTGGLMPPRAGSYRLFGEPMPIFDEPRLKIRLRMALVFETGQLFNHLTVRENIGLPLRYHKNLDQADAFARVSEFLEALGLEAFADSTPGAMARNWQKRVALARALILEPDLLLLDAPLTGLDLRHLNWWLKFMNDLWRGHPLLRRPVTLVVTAADLRPWRGRAHQFATLRERHFEVLGTWQQVESASSELVRELLAVEKQGN